MFSDSIPIWGVLLGTLGLVALALEAGFLVGRRRQRRTQAKSDGAGAMVGATMGLLAFMLAFTFNGASGRHDSRKTLVIDEANAIHQAWLRAGLLPDSFPLDVRALLREYVDVRVKAAGGDMEIDAALRRSEELQDRIWALALEVGHRNPGSMTNSLFIQSVNEVIDLHLKRLTVAVRNRVPPTIWAALYLLTIFAMVMMGAQAGLGGTRHLGIGLALAASFAVVLTLIADLDRPQEGLVNVSQQAMVELQGRLNAK